MPCLSYPNQSADYVYLSLVLLNIQEIGLLCKGLNNKEDTNKHLRLMPLMSQSNPAKSADPISPTPGFTK